MLALEAGDYRLELEPSLGGSIARFDWRGEPLMRRRCGPSILDAACFPLVPFSNRIAGGRFVAEGRAVHLSANMPSISTVNPLHGHGWLAAWNVVAADVISATLAYAWPGGEWPWPYRAEQRFALDEGGLTIALSVTNLADSAMPAGLGFHPYFPCDAATIYHGLHRGEWRNDADCLPVALDERTAARDWWEGRPAAARCVDTVYTAREGALAIRWPDRDIALILSPSPELADTVVYVPDGGDFLCVEPVSHATDAVNRAGEMRMLAAGETFAVSLHLGVDYSRVIP